MEQPSRFTPRCTSRAPRYRGRRPCPLVVWQDLGVARPPARSDHAGCLRVLRGSLAIRRFHRRGLRNFRRRAHRSGPGGPESSHSAQSWPADGRSDRRRSGLVVHHHGTKLPGSIDGRGCRHSGKDRSGQTPRSLVSKSDRTWPAGSSSNRSGHASSASNPTCWSKCRRGRPGSSEAGFRTTKIELSS